MALTTKSGWKSLSISITKRLKASFYYPAFILQRLPSLNAESFPCKFLTLCGSAYWYPTLVAFCHLHRLPWCENRRTLYVHIVFDQRTTIHVLLSSPPSNPPSPPIWVGKINHHFPGVFLPPSNSLWNISDFLRIFANFQACVTRADAQRPQHYNIITKNKGNNSNISLSLRYVL